MGTSEREEGIGKGEFIYENRRMKPAEIVL
jgi:hypothetical protein